MMIDRLAAVSVMVFVSNGCARAEFNDARASNAEYRECVSQHGEESEVCGVLREQTNKDFDRYDQRAQDAWDCKHTSDGCPGERIQR